jgi:hypothetical protein
MKQVTGLKNVSVSRTTAEALSSVQASRFGTEVSEQIKIKAVNIKLLPSDAGMTPLKARCSQRIVEELFVPPPRVVQQGDALRQSDALQESFGASRRLIGDCYLVSWFDIIACPPIASRTLGRRNATTIQEERPGQCPWA